MICLQVDNRDSVEPKVTPEQAVKLCDRNFGVGADGVIFVLPGVQGTDYSMRIFNSDGSEPEVYSALSLINLYVAQMSFLAVYLRKRGDVLNDKLL